MRGPLTLCRGERTEIPLSVPLFRDGEGASLSDNQPNNIMSKPRVYQPALHPFLIKGLYHESKRRGVPMTKLLTEIVSDVLDNTEGLRQARDDPGRDQSSHSTPSATSPPPQALCGSLQA